MSSRGDSKSGESNSSSKKTVWDLIQEQQEASESKEEGDQPSENPELKVEKSLESNVIVVGSKGSGKTSMIASHMSKDKVDDPKPTTALDYKFTRSTVGMSAEKNLCHFWELGGGKSLENLMDICLTPERLEHCLVIIVLDLSTPYTVVEDALYWLKTVKQRVSGALATLSMNDSEKATNIEKAAKTRFGVNHEDLTQGVELCPVKIMLLAHKWDSVCDLEPELLKILAKTLRYIAHSHGASLHVSSTRDKNSINVFKSTLIKHVANKPEQKIFQTDHTKPVTVIPAGSDSFDAIGDQPDGSKGSLRGWKALMEKYFVDDGKNAKKSVGVNIELTPEPVVDAMLAQKKDELLAIERKANLDQKMRRSSVEM